MANLLQISKVEGQCDKLAAELSWQRLASKVVNFQLPHLHLTYRTCIWRFCWGWLIWVLPRFSRFSASENQAIVWRCFRDPTVIHLSGTPTCDRLTDRQTHNEEVSRWWVSTSVKAKFHYARCFEAGPKPVADRFEAKFHYAIWFEACSKLVADRFEAGWRLASNQLA